jgi:hypothetical protein
MSRQVVVIAFPVLFVLLVLGVAYASRRTVTSRLYAGTGLEDWRRVASDLSWRDRWTLYRANATGRAAPPQLAAHAVQRGEVVVACVESSTARRSTLRRLWLGLGVFSLVACAFNIWVLTTGERQWQTWGQVATQGWLALLWLGQPALQRRQLPKVRRSVERNRAIAAAHSTPTAG